MKKQGDVLFNIMTSFKLSGKTGSNEYDLNYGELAGMEYVKQNDRNYGKEPLLLKIN